MADGFNIHQLVPYASVSTVCSIMIVDTLLNVFLAIAVDNLANAQELTAAEEADERAHEMSEDSETFDEQVCIIFCRVTKIRVL